MATIPKRCTTETCKTYSCARCHCCDKDLCLDHLKEHRDRLQEQLTVLVHDANEVSDNIHQLASNTQPTFDSIEQWRIQAHQTVEAFSQKLCRQFAQQHSKVLDVKMRQTKNTLHELIQSQGASKDTILSIQESMASIRRDLANVSQSEISLKPLIIDESAVLSVKSKKVAPQNKTAQKKNDGGSQNAQQTKTSQNEELEALKTGHAFQIFVETSSERLILVIQRFETIQEIKYKIRDRAGVPKEKQRLTFMGKTLDDKRSVADYDFQNGSTLKMTILLDEPNSDPW